MMRRARRRVPHLARVRSILSCAPVWLALAWFGAFAAPASSAPSQSTFTVYGLGAAEQFLNHQDDRARGEGNNPFGRFLDSPATLQASGNGPYPGDQGIYLVNLYASPNQTTKVGTAQFSCIYNFGKNGYCDVSFHVHQATVFGSGEFNFNNRAFSLVVVGGYGQYARATGTVDASPVANHFQAFAFALK